MAGRFAFKPLPSSERRQYLVSLALLGVLGCIPDVAPLDLSCERDEDCYSADSICNEGLCALGSRASQTTPAPEREFSLDLSLSAQSERIEDAFIVCMKPAAQTGVGSYERILCTQGACPSIRDQGSYEPGDYEFLVGGNTITTLGPFAATLPSGQAMSEDGDLAISCSSIERAPSCTLVIALSARAGDGGAPPPGCDDL